MVSGIEVVVTKLEHIPIITNVCMLYSHSATLLTFDVGLLCSSLSL